MAANAPPDHAAAARPPDETSVPAEARPSPLASAPSFDLPDPPSRFASTPNLVLPTPSFPSGPPRTDSVVRTAASDATPVSPRRVLLTARSARRRRHTSPAVTGGGPSAEGTRALLRQMQARHEAYAAMHTAAGRSAAEYHRYYTVAILVLSLATSLATYTLSAFEDERWTTLASNIALTATGALTAINNFLGFQKREEQHRVCREAHLNAASLVDIAFACDADNGEEPYDYSGVLTDLEDIHKALQTHAVQFPEWVARMYPEYEAPWLLRPRLDESDA